MKKTVEFLKPHTYFKMFPLQTLKLQTFGEIADPKDKGEKA